MYRFLSKLATLDRLQAFPVPIPGREIRTGLGLVHYERKMEPLEINSDIDGVRLFKAPIFQTRPTGLCLKFHEGYETRDLPDIWGCFCKLFVSQTVRNIIERIDDFEHEFTKIEWIDCNDQVVETDQNYYLFNQRRWLQIIPSDQIVKKSEVSFFPERCSEDFLGRLINDAFLCEYLDGFPIWQSFGKDSDIQVKSLRYRSILYLNKDLVEEFKNNNITYYESSLVELP